jgi:hypothetical protein
MMDMEKPFAFEFKVYRQPNFEPLRASNIGSTTNLLLSVPGDYIRVRGGCLGNCR